MASVKWSPWARRRADGPWKMSLRRRLRSGRRGSRVSADGGDGTDAPGRRLRERGGAEGRDGHRRGRSRAGGERGGPSPPPDDEGRGTAAARGAVASTDAAARTRAGSPPFTVAREAALQTRPRGSREGEKGRVRGSRRPLWARPRNGIRDDVASAEEAVRTAFGHVTLDEAADEGKGSGGRRREELPDHMSAEWVSSGQWGSLGKQAHPTRCPGRNGSERAYKDGFLTEIAGWII